MMITESGAYRAAFPRAPARPSHRARRRYPAYLDADIDTGYLRVRGTVLSLSDAGLFTTADLPLRSGTRITMSFQLPNLQPVNVLGEVIYEAALLDHRGIGVRFLPSHGTEEGASAIRRFYQAS